MNAMRVCLLLPLLFVCRGQAKESPSLAIVSAESALRSACDANREEPPYDHVYDYICAKVAHTNSLRTAAVEQAEDDLLKACQADQRQTMSDVPAALEDIRKVFADEVLSQIPEEEKAEFRAKAQAYKDAKRRYYEAASKVDSFPQINETVKPLSREVLRKKEELEGQYRISFNTRLDRWRGNHRIFSQYPMDDQLQLHAFDSQTLRDWRLDFFDGDLSKNLVVALVDRRQGKNLIAILSVEDETFAFSSLSPDRRTSVRDSEPTEAVNFASEQAYVWNQMPAVCRSAFPLGDTAGNSHEQKYAGKVYPIFPGNPDYRTVPGVNSGTPPSR